MTEKLSQLEVAGVDWLTAQEVCSLLRITAKTLGTMVREGTAPPSFKSETGFRRFSRAGLETWVEARMEPSGASSS